MSARVNRQGLARRIPPEVRREVRRRSKFGCVICRSGFYEYEHIAEFADISQHDPAHICCLCEACHGRVTRGQWSKEYVRSKYTELQRLGVEEAGHPSGPLDFHTGDAVLAVGDLLYAPAVATVLRYFGDDLIKLTPGKGGEPGMISAVFTDDEGNAILELDENEWLGSMEAWDIEVTGTRITVRQRKGAIALQLRLDPPGRIVLERLDMRIGAHHILVSEHSYAVGAHIEGGDPWWFSPQLTITKALDWAVAIELDSSQKLRDRFRYFSMAGKGKWLASPDERFIFHSPAGVMVPEFEVSIATGCSFRQHEVAAGARPLGGMRDAVFHRSAKDLRKYIAIGE